jgi:hypothetical protein
MVVCVVAVGRRRGHSGHKVYSGVNDDIYTVIRS